MLRKICAIAFAALLPLLVVCMPCQRSEAQHPFHSPEAALTPPPLPHQPGNGGREPSHPGDQPGGMVAFREGWSRPDFQDSAAKVPEPDDATDLVPGAADSHTSPAGLGEGHDLAEVVIDRSAFRDPPLDARPAIRWWWPGGDVDDVELARELAAMRSAGFSAAEVQSFAVGLPEDAAPEVKTYGTPTWFEHLAAAASSAQSLGMRLDVTLGSSWPTAGSQVSDTQSLQQLIMVKSTVEGPGMLDADFPMPEKPIRYTVAKDLLALPDTFDASKMSPVAAMAVKTMDGSTAGQAVPAPAADLPELLPTVYLDQSSIVDLGPFVSSGRIHWPVPEGSWVVFAFYQGPTGAGPFYGADPGNGGLVVDHFNQDAITAFLQSFGQNLADRLGSRFGTVVRSLFVDSVELRTDLFWTRDILSEFAARRGYRLEPFLPILFIPYDDDAYLRNAYRDAPPQFEFQDAGPRVRYDFDRTVSELMVERYFRPIASWAADHGVATRIQAHGSPADLLNAYRTAAVPETEGLYAGGQPQFLKLAASAAHWNNTPLVSSEILAFRNVDATPGLIIREANRQFAAGVNHLVMHGFPYQYNTGFESPGWVPFRSPYLPAREVIGTFGTRLNETSPFWSTMPAVNRRLARTQLALRVGKPVVEIALFTDRVGYPDDVAVDPTVSRQIERSGQNYDYVNGDLLGAASVAQGKLLIGARSYRALVLDNVKRLPVDVAGKIIELASNGLPVIFVGDVPYQSASYLNWQGNDAVVQRFFEQLFGKTWDEIKQESKLHSGSALFIADASQLGVALAGDLDIDPDVILSDDRDDIRFVHRQTETADYYFITSSRDLPFDTVVSFSNRNGQPPQVFDLPTGGVAFPPVYHVEGDRTVLPIHLEPGGAVLIGFEDGVTPPSSHVDNTDVPFVTRGTDGSIIGSVLHPGTYTITVGGQTQSVHIGGDSLPPIDLPIWDLTIRARNSRGQAVTYEYPHMLPLDLSVVPELQGIVGSATYSVYCNVTQAHLAEGVRLILNLGLVFDTAAVKVNGQAVETLLAAPYRLDIRDYLTSGLNYLEAEVTLAGSAPAGLIGPAHIVPSYQLRLDGAAAVRPAPLPLSVVVTPPNFPDSTQQEMLDAIRRAAELTNHVNFQWFWKTPPSSHFPDGGATVGCEQVTPWVKEARGLGLDVTLQFQTFATQLRGPNMAPYVRVTTPLKPWDQASYADKDVQKAYLEEITCLAGLQPEYLVLGPEVNFVAVYAPEEFEHFKPVYLKAYNIVKSISPWTQVGLSWQYDGLRQDLLFSAWEYIPGAGPQDFVGLTTYFGFSEGAFRNYPTVADIPADYYRPIRARLGQEVPVIFTEIGYSSQFPNGLAAQVEFLDRLPRLLEEVHPVSVTWAMLHDVDYFIGPAASLNMSGLLQVSGAAKPVWDEAIRMKHSGSLLNVVSNVFRPVPMPFSLTAVPKNFPTTFTRQDGFDAIATASQVSRHVSLQFTWWDRVTHQTWGCAEITPYVQEARRQGLDLTIQFNTYAVEDAANKGGLPHVLLLNPIHPPGSSDAEPSMSMADIRESYLDEVACLAALQPDYLVLGPEVNFLLGNRPEEFKWFGSAYQEAYARAKEASPNTQVGVSYQYHVIRNNYLKQDNPWYVETLGPQDFIGLTTHFAFSDQANAEYPAVPDVPADFYEPVRLLFGPDVPVVFTEIGWSSYYPNGRENQVQFVNRLPSLMQKVKPVNVIWVLAHDVLDYFAGEIVPLNYLGLRQYDGTPKPAWDQVVKLRAKGLYVTPAPVR